MSKTTVTLSVLLAAGALLVGVGINHELLRPTAPSTLLLRPSGSLGAPGTGHSPQAHRSESSVSGGTAGFANVSAIAAAIDPGLVDINATLDGQGKHTLATGIVLTRSGQVLTNNHVIDGATAISAIDVGSGRTYQASVVGYDRSHDIAVLQLTGPSGLKTAALGDSAKIAVGQTVVAVGNAGGVGGPPSAAAGWLVAFNERVVASDESGTISERLSGLIEVNANVQPGDSGGPLVNSSGQVIGVDTAALADFSFHPRRGQAYAIPIDQALAIAAQIEGGRSSTAIHIGPTAFLGVELSSATSRATVHGVFPGSPAAKAGLAPGDVVTSLAGRAVDSQTALISLLDRCRPGNRVRLAWSNKLRQQRTTSVKLVVGPAR